MQRFIICAVVLVIASLLLTSQGRTQKPEKVKELMKAKLQKSQDVLEALALEDFDKLTKHSQQLALLSLDASWQVLQTEEYVQHSMDFRRHAHAIRDAAKKKNIDGAALAYVQMTLTCVNCHKYVRNTRMAAVDGALDRFASH